MSQFRSSRAQQQSYLDVVIGGSLIQPSNLMQRYLFLFCEMVSGIRGEQNVLASEPKSFRSL